MIFFMFQVPQRYTRPILSSMYKKIYPHIVKFSMGVESDHNVQISNQRHFYRYC